MSHCCSTCVLAACKTGKACSGFSVNISLLEWAWCSSWIGIRYPGNILALGSLVKGWLKVRSNCKQSLLTTLYLIYFLDSKNLYLMFSKKDESVFVFVSFSAMQISWSEFQKLSNLEKEKRNSPVDVSWGNAETIRKCSRFGQNLEPKKRGETLIFSRMSF